MINTKPRSRQQSLDQKGFTIIELMIASGVLATILLIVTVVMIGIGNLYYKGISQARVQDDTRTIIDEVTNNLRLSGGSLATDTWAANNEEGYCIGNVRYTYVLNVQIGKPPPAGGPVYKHVLWKDVNPTPGSCDIGSIDLTQDTPSGGGTEMIAPYSRLTVFCIGASVSASNCPYGSISNSSPFPLTVGVAYGEDDLLTLNGYDTQCKGHTGDRFCSTARLKTTAVQRL